jgi:hypothetical protein
MHRRLALGIFARGVRAIGDASAEAFGTQGAPLSALASLLAYKHGTSSAAIVSASPMMLTAAAGPASALHARGLHASSGALADDRAAAVRRLAAARTRRVKASDSESATARERAGIEEQALVEHQQQQQTDVVPSTSTALTVTPSEGRASDVQLAAALDHPALIVTRPIEWWVVGARCWANKQQQRARWRSH